MDLYMSIRNQEPQKAKSMLSINGNKFKKILSSLNLNKKEQDVNYVHQDRVHHQDNIWDGSTPLMAACFHGLAEIVKLLLTHKTLNVNHQNGNKETAFYVACSKGRVDVVKMMLEDRRVDVNRRSKDGTTPFIVACRKGHLEVVRLMINHPIVDVNKPDLLGRTALYHVCMKGSSHEVIKVLLENERINPNKSNHYMDTPFYIACKFNQVQVVELLLKSQRINLNQPNEDGLNPFYISCFHNHIQIVQLLIKDYRIDINQPLQTGQTPLMIAVHGEFIEIVELLLNDHRIQTEAVTLEDNCSDYVHIPKNTTAYEMAKILKLNEVINLFEKRKEMNDFKFKPIGYSNMKKRDLIDSLLKSCSEGDVETTQVVLNTLKKLPKRQCS